MALKLDLNNFKVRLNDSDLKNFQDYDKSSPKYDSKESTLVKVETQLREN